MTRDNREEYVRLYIDYWFTKQCAEQLKAFRKGFERIVEIRLLRSFLTPEDLQQIVCGQKSLNFKELRDVSRYGGKFHAKHPTVQWFWQVVIDEWDDDMRRQLLVFATGTDRAPINGLKSMEFFLIENPQHNDSHIPRSHTCFNQLEFPAYSSKDILRTRFLKALEYGKDLQEV